METLPSVAIILLNWNGYKDTFECIKSLETIVYSNFHVFVVDNDSTDGSFEKLNKDLIEGTYKVDVTLLRSECNLGCAGGNNLGIKKAYELGYKYIWMLNNDTFAEPESLLNLVNVMEKNEKIGITGSKIYYANTKVLWFAGGLVNRYLGTSKLIGINKEDKGQHDQLKKVDFIVGCSMLFRSCLVKEIGFLKEDYFIYYEDTDWNIKAQKKGWDIFYVPTSVIHHKESNSMKNSNLSPLTAYYLIRNGYLMVKSNYGQFEWAAFAYLIIRILKFHLIYVLRSENKIKRSKLILKGAYHGIRNKTGQFTG